MRRYNGLAAYDRSKLAMVLFTRELARRGEAAGIRAYAADPGLVRTDIGAKGGGPLVRLVWRLRSARGIAAEQSAASLFFLASDPGAGKTSGLYWKDGIPHEPSARARSRGEAIRLWEQSEGLCGVRFPEGLRGTREQVYA